MSDDLIFDPGDANIFKFKDEDDIYMMSVGFDNVYLSNQNLKNILEFIESDDTDYIIHSYRTKSKQQTPQTHIRVLRIGKVNLRDGIVLAFEVLSINDETLEYETMNKSEIDKFKNFLQQC